MLQLRNCPEASRKGCQAVLDGEYDFESLNVGDNPTIVDCGANIGSFCLWAKHKWPNAIIHAYEPLRETYGILAENVEGLKNVHAYQTAVGDVDGKAPLFMPRPGGSLGEASFRRDLGEQDLTKAWVVNVMHAGKLPACDLLKIDTEGSELEILTNYTHLDKCKAIVLEWHSHEDRVKIRSFLSQAGFSLVQDTEWHWAGRGLQKWSRPFVPHLFVGVLAGGGQVWAEHNRCVMLLQQACPQAGINISLKADSGTGVDRSRNRLVADALADKSMTHFMFLDNDIVFDPAWVIGMVRSGLDVVGGAYPRKQIDWEAIERAVKNGVAAKDLPKYSSSFIINHLVDNNGGTNAISCPGVGDFVEVEEVGTGFLMISRSALEGFISDWEDEISYVTDYEPRGEVHHMVFSCKRDPACELEKAASSLKSTAVAYHKGGGREPDMYEVLIAANNYAKAVAKGKDSLGRYLTEDYSFCRMWRMGGGKVYIYIDAAIEHLGTMKFEGRVKEALGLKRVEETQQQEEEQKVGPV